MIRKSGELGNVTTSLSSGRDDAESLLSTGRIMFGIVTALLMALAVTLVLVCLSDALGVAPANDLDLLATAYGQFEILEQRSFRLMVPSARARLARPRAPATIPPHAA